MTIQFNSMTTIREIEQKCPVCGKSSPQRMIGSTSTWGYPDLDLRPAEMQRSSMFAWLMECPHCGYVSGSFRAETGITEYFLKGEEYLNCRGFEFKSALAEKFFKAYLIAEKQNDCMRSFHNLLHCAWACDDAEDMNAKEIRMLALSYIDNLEYGEDEKKNYLCIKSDLLRRSGQFNRVVEEFKDIIIGEETYDKVINFQIEKAGKKDTACYTVEDVIKP